MSLLRIHTISTGLAAIILCGGACRPTHQEGPREAAVVTVGDLRAMHASVAVAGTNVRGSARLSDGDTVTTGPDGRARIRLDDGALVVVDGTTVLTLHGARIALEHGRIFVQTGAASHTEVAFGAASTTMVSSAAAFERSGTGVERVYCPQGELVLTASGKQEHVASGETASIEHDAVKVAPETAFDDWTGGLAVPWSGERGPASAIAELWGGAGGDDPGSPLVVRAVKVGVDVDGEVAVTHTRTSYFNGSDRSVVADVRMALPPGAIVSRVARADGGTPTDAQLDVGTNACAQQKVGRLEWAGSGQLRGALPSLGAGKTVDLLVDYAEWLPGRAGRETYRFPMTNEHASSSSTIGDLSATVRSNGATRWISSSAGTTLLGDSIELHRTDVRITGDLVVELSSSAVHAGAARVYVEQGGKNEDPFVLVRTEVPDLADQGVTLAVVVDTSMSIGASLLEAERAVVDALLDGLGSRDAIVVLAADQTVKRLGVGKPAPVTAALRAQIRQELAAIHAGGASNLGAALEQAADALDDPGSEHPGSGMVIYLGDGRPTVGEADARTLRERLARRAGGVPRLGAVAMGQGADRWMLAELAAGAGPIYEVVDRPDAARAGAALVADAMEPTLRDVELDLGPTIDRIYPREARAALAGSTVTVAGRLRGKLPDHIGFRFRRGATVGFESRPLDNLTVPAGADVARRWAQARIEDTVTRGDGVELAMTLAKQSRLLTPWTSWFFTGNEPNCSAPFDERVLGLMPGLDTAFAAKVEPAPPPPSLLLEPPATLLNDASLDEATERAARRAIDGSLAALVACRDARAAARPGVGGELRINLVLSPLGRATSIRVSSVRALDDDAQLDRCLGSVVGSIPFFATGITVNVTHQMLLPEEQASRRTRCSVTSTLPLPVRRGIWRSREEKGTLDYSTAAHTCELPTWTDRRALLGILTREATPSQAIAIAGQLDRAGETDAAAFVRQDVMRHADLTTVASEDLRRLLIGDEPKIDQVLDTAYRAARTDEDRLVVVRRFLGLAPHSPLGRRLLLSLLESMGKRDALLVEIAHLRTDPFADAGLLAAAGSTLRRIDREDEGRRVFGELVERAPRDPWTLGFVGDRLRAEGLYDDALAAYSRLDRAMPGDTGVILRLALAHAGAGRLDVATRLLDRVAATGGRGDDGRMSELASIVSGTLLAGARETAREHDGAADALLARRLAQTPLPDVESLILVRAPPAERPVRVTVERQEKDHDGEPADLDAAAMGLSAVRVERGGGTLRIRLRRVDGPGSTRPLRATVTALILGEDRARAKLVTREVDVPSGGQGIELRWEGGTLL